MKISVVIPAAGSIAGKFTSLRPQFSSAGLFPVNSKSLLSYSLDFYCQQKDVEVTVLANSKDEQTLRTELPLYKFKLVTVDNTKSIIETLQVFLESDASLTEDVIISVVTTIPAEFPAPGSIVLSERQEFCHFYSAVADIENGKPKFFHRGSGADYFGYPFTGIIRTTLADLKAVLPTCSSNDLLEVAEKLYAEGKLGFKKTEWIDCGHEVNYTEAKARLLSSRSFNSLSVEMISGILEKKSTNIKKFIDETKYVDMLPADLKIFFPRVIEELKTNRTHASIKMDYFSYPNIAELQLYRDLEEVQWHRIFDAFEFVLKKFSSYKDKISKKDFFDFYLGKTLKREADNEKWIQENQLGFLLNDDLIINGQKCFSFKTLLDQTNTVVGNLFNENDFCVMHGDFCFNNILYDSYSGTIRLIDPRGSFGENLPGIYGDIKYDLAKLLHSSVYCYDYIVNDLSHFEVAGNTIDYSFNLRPNHRLLESLSFELVKKMGFDPKNISILVALLFISMCPLHSDSLRRQKLMYTHGLYLLNKFLN
jgi:hypothetical protein